MYVGMRFYNFKFVPAVLLTLRQESLSGGQIGPRVAKRMGDASGGGLGKQLGAAKKEALAGLRAALCESTPSEGGMLYELSGRHQFDGNAASAIEDDDVFDAMAQGV